MQRNRPTKFWSMFNGQLIIYPMINAGTTVEITGVLSPPEYTDADLHKDLVRVPDDQDTQVQGLSPLQTKLLRYYVVKRLLEDIQDFDKAGYIRNEILTLKHQMRAYHEDQDFTDSNGEMFGG